MTVEQRRDLYSGAVGRFRANLRHPRAVPLLVDYYLKQGLPAEDIRLAAQQAATGALPAPEMVIPTVPA